MSVEPRKESHQNLSFQKSKNPKTPTQVSDFWKLEEFAQNPKKPKFLEFPKFQKSKNPNPSFGFFGNSRNLLKILILEFPKFQKSKNPNPTRAGASKSKKTQNSSSFQNSKNPKIPTPVSDFWKLEEFAQNPKKPKIPRVSKIQKSKNPNPSFGFLETRGILDFFGF